MKHTIPTNYPNHTQITNALLFRPLRNHLNETTLESEFFANTTRVQRMSEGPNQKPSP